jgi:DNA repair photolyase
MRLGVIYGPDGRAGEYARDGLAANLYKGCPHACVYCSAPATLRMTKADFHKCATPKNNVLEKFEQDCETLHTRGITSGKIFMSFVCDPYCPEERGYGITRGAIEIAHRHSFGVDILTKAGRLAQRDFDILGDSDSFGVTLTSMDRFITAKWELWAGCSNERADSLRDAHWIYGIPTWVSLEPVIDPEESLEIIRQTHEFVDFYKVGKLNYHPRASTIDWRKFAVEVKDLLDDLGCEYLLKEDLRRYLPMNGGRNDE